MLEKKNTPVQIKARFSTDFEDTTAGYNLVALAKVHLHKHNLTQLKLF